VPNADYTAAWIRRRARNVYRRPTRLARYCGVLFAIMMLAIVALSRAVARSGSSGIPVSARADTVALRSAARRAEGQQRAAEIAILEARARWRASVVQSDTVLPAAAQARRDSLSRASVELARLLERTDDAPLVGSFRALGSAPAMQGVPRVPQLLDSLNDLEKARADFGAPDGVDPIFLALTARVGAIGREIEGIARVRRAAMRREIESLTPAPAPAPAPSATVDTTPLLAQREAAMRARLAAGRALTRVRHADSVRRAREERAASALFGVGNTTLVVAAAVLSMVATFAIALAIELRWPRVSDVAEAELLSGARALATVRRQPDPPERQRRRADREVPPAIEQSSDSYRLLYSQLASATFDLSLIAIAGDDPYVTVSVAANLAANAARSGRPTLLLDTDFQRQPVATMMRVAPSPGVADVLARRIGWAEAITSVLVSRGRSVDVLPSGTITGTLQAVSEEFSAEVQRLGRRYDTVVLSASTPEQGTVASVAAAAGEVVICLRLARTTHASLRALLAAVDMSGARVRGLVLWAGEAASAPPPYVPDQPTSLELLG
jgi:hypothetical protein